jgi:group II intron reverse transcriptase/maturase
MVEGRGVTKGNSLEQNALRTQGRVGASSALERVRAAARRDRRQRFTALLHHVYDIGRLRAAYYSLQRRAAAGVDGETWQHYGKELEQNLQDLSGRLRRGAYRAKPVRRVYIAKTDGSQRPLGVPTLEDKIVQRAVVEVLNAIYEADFLGMSYGFRPGRSPHRALDALAVGIQRRKVNWVLDADIRGFFEALDHGWLVKFIEHRVADRRVVHLIQKWLKAGVLEDGTRTRREAGTVQGGSISPLLANIYLHYVFDLWTQRWRQRTATGDMIVIRYADDIVLGFQNDSDARHFQRELSLRLEQFALDLHPKKTHLIRFGRFARQQCRKNGEGKPPTFDFLGFTHYCTISRTNGRFMVGRKSIKTRVRAQLHEIKRALRQRLHRPIGETGAWLQRVLRGHLNYYAVPGNQPSLRYFFRCVSRYWFRSLRRRSQRHRMNWHRFNGLWLRFAPPILLVHDHPARRFDATTRGRSPVR